MKKFEHRYPDGIVLHHSASSWAGVNTEVIREWHLSRGFADIGYHFVITKEGVIEEGRPLKYKGAHCKAQQKNHTSIGVCLVGDSTKDGFKPIQRKALVYLIGYLEARYGQVFKISQHSDWEPNKPYCAGFTAEQFEGLRDV